MTVRISSKALSLREYMHQLRGLLSKEPVGLEQGDARYVRQGNPLTVSELPTSPPTGTHAFVTDATTTTFAATVVGGGSNGLPVYYDGTNWKIG